METLILDMISLRKHSKVQFQQAIKFLDLKLGKETFKSPWNSMQIITEASEMIRERVAKRD